MVPLNKSGEVIENYFSGVLQNWPGAKNHIVHFFKGLSDIILRYDVTSHFVHVLSNYDVIWGFVHLLCIVEGIWCFPPNGTL
eukprot:TRINITY_DN994_c0_g1_i1.p1 TRINITY_DN994_c0_g1~~TRINITY_DN994_c0_g1_i1.p1  ORF type:complete len:82 (-),score=1.47 TRINITY_DN994_c0_g1_i1:404-649(-)